MRILFYSLFALIFKFGIFSLHAQDPHFTQFNSSPLQLNPAMAGSSGYSRIVSMYRNQWPSLSGNFISTHISYDRHINALKGGIGITALHDIAGQTIKTTHIGIIYSPVFAITEQISLKPSFEADYFKKSIDWSRLTFGDMIDPRSGFVYNTKETPGANSIAGIDFSSGIFMYSSKWNSGIAVHHLTQPEVGLIGKSKLP